MRYCEGAMELETDKDSAALECVPNNMTLDSSRRPIPMDSVVLAVGLKRALLVEVLGALSDPRTDPPAGFMGV
jgi:hypothetical protein